MYLRKRIKFICVIAAGFLIAVASFSSALASVRVMDVVIPSDLGTDMANIRTYTTISSGQTIGGAGDHGLAQNFFVAQKYITGVAVYLRSGNNETLTMKFDDFWTHQTLKTMSQSISTSAGWVEFNFDTPIESNLEHNYGVYLSSGSAVMRWVYIDEDNYKRGYALKNGSAQEYDYSLIVYTTASLEQPAAPGGEEANSGAGTTASSDSSIAASTAGTASTTVTVDESIAAPTLDYIIANGVKTNSPIPAGFSIKKDDNLTIKGSSFKNAKVVINIGEKSYNTLADKAGKWEITVPTEELALGNVVVNAQAQDLVKNKGSKVVELFKMVVQANATSASQPTTATEQSFWAKLCSGYLYYVYAAGAIIIIGLAVLEYFLIRKRRLNKVSS